MTVALPEVHAMGASEFVAIGRAIDADPNKTPTQTVRELRGLSQGELAARSGVCADDIVSLEDGEAPHALLLASVAFTLDVPASLLLGETQRQENAPDRIVDAFRRVTDDAQSDLRNCRA